MNSEKPDFKHCGFACLFYLNVKIFFYLFDRLFYSCRMNSAVGDKFFKCNSCNLSPDRIET